MNLDDNLELEQEILLKTTAVFSLRRMLIKAREAIETAITSEDGLDGNEGQDLLVLIDDTLRRT